MRVLYLVPARKGSKGLPGKNTKPLNGIPLVAYTLRFALENIQPGDEICVSTDDEEVIAIAEDLGIKVPFVRPAHLSSDTAGSYEVIMHSLNEYAGTGKQFDAVLLLQPTSPFRSAEDLQKVFAEFDVDCDMVVTVKEAKENPYFSLFEEDEEGLLVKSKAGNFERRQDCPLVYAYNGSMYLMSTVALAGQSTLAFNKIKKVLMPPERSLDIDTMADWVLAEYYAEQVK